MLLDMVRKLLGLKPSDAKKQAPQGKPPRIPTVSGIVEKSTQHDRPSVSAQPKQKRKRNALDHIQTAGDVAGVFDITGIVDGLNSVLSFGRAYRSKDTAEMREHTIAGVARAVSAVPGGDVAKVPLYAGKVAKAAKVARAIQTADDVTKAAKAAKVARAIQTADDVTQAGKVAKVVRAAQTADDVTAVLGPPRSRRGGQQKPPDPTPPRSPLQRLRGFFGAVSSRPTGQPSVHQSIPERIRNIAQQARDPEQRKTMLGRAAMFMRNEQPRDPKKNPDWKPYEFSPQERMGMMGMPAQQVEQIRQQREQERDEKQANDELKEAGEQVVESFKNIAKAGLNPVKMLTAMATAGIGFVVAMKKASTVVVESRRGISGYDGRTASAFAAMDVQSFRADIRTGKQTATSTVDLVTAVRDLRSATQPFRELTTSATNRITQHLATFAAFLSKIAANTLFIEQIHNWLEASDRDPENEATRTVEVMRQFEAVMRNNAHLANERQPLPPLGR